MAVALFLGHFLAPPTRPGNKASMIQQYALQVAIRYIYQVAYSGTLGGIMLKSQKSFLNENKRM